MKVSENHQIKCSSRTSVGVTENKKKEGGTKGQGSVANVYSSELFSLRGDKNLYICLILKCVHFLFTCFVFWADLCVSVCVCVFVPRVLIVNFVTVLLTRGWSISVCFVVLGLAKNSKCFHKA